MDSLTPQTSPADTSGEGEQALNSSSVRDQFFQDLTPTDALPPLETLKCALCGDFFKDPLTLGCMHTFCTSCLLKAHDATEADLEEFLAPPPPRQAPVAPPAPVAPQVGGGADGSAAAQQPVVPQIPEEPPRRRLECPTCTKVLGLDPPEDPTEPFPNARLARIVKLVHDTPVLCENCKQSESEKLCSVCKVHCCQPCWDKTHSAPIFAKHEGKPLRHSEMTALPKCSQHILNDQEFFVTADEVGACQVCLLKGDYVGAQYALVNDVRNERQGELEAGIEDVLAQRERLEYGKEETEEVLVELEKNHQESIAAVKQNFQAIREALQRREQETLQALDELKKAKKNVLEEQVEQSQIVMSQIDDGVRNVKLVLKYSNPLEVIYQTYVIDEHLKTIGNVPSTAPRVCMQCQKDQAPCHHPAVDASLPVLLSDRVPAIVMAYAAVPSPQSVQDVAYGVRAEADIAPQATEEQKQVLKQVASAAQSEEEYGCSIM